MTGNIPFRHCRQCECTKQRTLQFKYQNGIQEKVNSTTASNNIYSHLFTNQKRTHDVRTFPYQIEYYCIHNKIYKCLAMQCKRTRVHVTYTQLSTDG